TRSSPSTYVPRASKPANRADLSPFRKGAARESNSATKPIERFPRHQGLQSVHIRKQIGSPQKWPGDRMVKVTVSNTSSPERRSLCGVGLLLEKHQSFQCPES